MVLGIPLGILIGLVTGIAFWLLVELARNGSGPGDTFKVVSMLLGIPTFWFAGGWLTGSSILKDVDPADIRSAYILTLTVAFVPFALLQAYRLVTAPAARASEGQARQEVAE
ncbi:MAG: hypothetical protein ACRDNR_14595 [Gaiellaceae bacterium]